MKRREELEQLIETAEFEGVKNMAKAELQKLDLQEKASQGDDLSKSLLVLKEAVDKMKGPTGSGVTSSGVSKEEVESMLRGILRTNKIRYDDLDAELKAKLAGQVKVMMTLNLPNSTGVVNSGLMLYQFERPMIQLILSDFKARNNTYLYGGAGTGKTYTAGLIADFLGYELVELNCNQFTSPLDIVGGQTIDGYQKGKLEIAWTNVNENDEPMKGAVLLLDELPKLDPNTAGLLNSALAKVREFKDNKPPIIRNGKGDKLEMKNIFIMATGNTRLNDTSTEYEANFKQDLSLQDRFAGSTYEILVDYQNEFDNLMKGFAFIWLYMVKVREVIIAESMTGWAFVSIRIMMNMKETYIVYREIESQKIASFKGKDLSLTKPKTLRQALDSFLNLFQQNQIDLIKEETDYLGFIDQVKQKDLVPLDSLDTQEEIDKARTIIDVEMAKQEKVIS